MIPNVVSVAGVQRPADRRAPVLLLCQMAAAMARMRSLGDADSDAFEGPAAVGFEVEQALEGVVDRFDQLADALEQRLAPAGGLVLAGRAAAA